MFNSYVYLVTEDPSILQNFLRLTEETKTSVNHVEVPTNSSSGSPQPTEWTNNLQLESFTAYVDGNYKKDLPIPPDDLYVNLDATRIGIIDGGIILELKRGISDNIELP